jgi:hypothetical protein
VLLAPAGRGGSKQAASEEGERGDENKNFKERRINKNKMQGGASSDQILSCDEARTSFVITIY